MRQSTWHLALRAVITVIDLTNKETSLPESGVRGGSVSRAGPARSELPRQRRTERGTSRSRAVEKKGWRDMVPGLSDGGGPAADQGLCTLLVEEF